jgi:hypothetical protein
VAHGLPSRGGTGAKIVTGMPSSQQESDEDFRRFDALVRKVLSVPHTEIMRREAEYKRQSALNPNRRGPKLKAKPPSAPTA